MLFGYFVQDAAAEAEAVRLAELRESWDLLLAEAAQCRQEDEQMLLLARIESLSADVATAGISLKYSKKVSPITTLGLSTATFLIGGWRDISCVLVVGRYSKNSKDQIRTQIRDHVLRHCWDAAELTL